MKPVKIRIAVEGINRKDIPLSEFVHIADVCRKLLEQTAKNVLDNGSCDFLLSGLSHSSPATMEITPISSLNPDAGLLVARSLAEQVRQIKSGKSESLPNNIMNSWKYMANRCNKHKIGRFSMSLNTDDELFDGSNALIFDLTSSISRNLRIMETLNFVRKNETVCLTSVIGRVEVVDTHKKKKIKVYPRIKGWKPVSVSFDDSLTQEVLISMNKIVEISGKGHYRSKQPLPYKMQMSSIRILPESSVLPKLSDLKGIAPGITNGKSVLEYRDDLRKEWKR